MPSLTQARRVAEFKSPLGKDKLSLARCEASEGLSELYEIRIDAISEDGNINFDTAIGADCSVNFHIEHGAQRNFCGVMTEAQWVGEAGDYYAYRIVLRPWLWLLTRTSDCRIFHDKNALEIIKKVFSDRGMTEIRDATTRTPPTREYCVQYRETDYNFVCRLMEDEGIYYYFEHTTSKHTMVLCDAHSSHKAIPKLETLEFIPSSSAKRNVQHVFSWTSERRFKSGKYELRDYNYLHPAADMTGPAQMSPANSRPNMEMYFYPGKYTEKSDGKTYAKTLLEAEIARDKRRHANGDALGLYPGGLTTLAKLKADAENQEYLVVRTSHVYVGQEYRSAGAGSQSEGYFGSYEFLPSSIQFRAPVVTPKPLVYGPQTAKVIPDKGNEGEEIDVDEHGRILVRFFWDRKKDQSCRVRVAQTWAANKWGTIVIPRIDQEVVVEFLEGDPDRPLVTGCVYNGDNKVPYPLPADKTMTGMKSDTSKGHGGYNEFVFDDKKSSELIRMHAEKDHEVVIKHAETWKIGETFEIPKGSPSRDTTILHGDDKLKVSTGDQNIDIAMEQNLTIGLSRTTKIGVSDTLQVGAKQDVTIGASQSVTVGASASEKVGASRSAMIGASDSLTVGASLSVTCGGVISIVGGGSSIIISPAGIIITGATISCVGPTLIPVLTAAGTINLHP